MTTPIAGVAVLRLAGWAQRQRFEAGVLPLEWQPLHHAVAGAAIGAADEGVAKPATLGIVEFAQAGVADGQIRAHQRCGRAIRLRGQDLQSGSATAGRVPAQAVLIDPCLLRRLADELRGEGFQCCAAALQLQMDAATAVSYRADHTMHRREAHHMGAQAHPLHQPLQVQAEVLLLFSRLGH